LIVLESESAYAELGAFAINEELAKNMLLINDETFKGAQSFIALGPVARVDRLSRFGKTIYVNSARIIQSAPDIIKRLQSVQPQKGTGFEITDAASFAALQPKIRMLLLLDIVTLFHPISHKEVINILKHIFGYSHFDVRLDLHMLEALRLVRRIDGYYVREIEERRLFFTYPGLRQLRIRSDVINHYHKYARGRTAVLRSKVRTV
jgi:hypothetical protein